MMFGYLTLFTALILSLSSAVYSVLGLTAIFAAAFWPIVILGGSLEFGKIVTTYGYTSIGIVPNCNTRSTCRLLW
jgi:hypothetical protein